MNNIDASQKPLKNSNAYADDVYFQCVEQC